MHPKGTAEQLPNYDLSILLKEKEVSIVFKIKSPLSAPLFLGVLFCISLSSTMSFASPSRYHLDVSFQPEEQSLHGRATISFAKGKEWQLYTGGMDILEVLLEEEGKKPVSLPLPQGDTISMYGSENNLQLTVEYSLKALSNAGNNLISSRGIVLTSGWHPLPQEDMLFSMSVSLPPGFKAISESDSPPEHSQDGKMHSSFSQAVRSIHLAAGPYQIKHETVREGLLLSTWFFKEDQQFSREYLDAAKAYILRYEKEIGPFPYTHYAIVSNRLPSGFGMPTFTLLGQMVLRLPFIKETSLGHEILHSWFGNSIEVADNSGNWCEGLTSYLADYAYATDKGQGASHRKAALVNYQSYVHQDSALTLEEFRSASHNQPMAKAKRSVGYNRSAMFFHQLRGLLGPEYFFQGLRLFANSFKGRPASWKDIQTAFESASGKNLEDIFKQQLSRNDAPALAVKKIHTKDKEDGSILHFNITQNSAQPYTLMVPIRVATVAGTQHSLHEITERETEISIPLSQPPLSFSIDPDYDLFRVLNPAELPPVWSRFSGAEHKLLILGEDNEVASLTPFIEWAETQGWTVLDNESVSNQQLSENSLLFLGAENKSYRSLFGKAPSLQKGFNLTVQDNPLNRKEVVVLLRSDSAQETQSALRKLKHYGKYSSLSFQQGRIQKKSIASSDQGLEVLLETLPNGGSTSVINSFDQIITELAKNRVIYLGEAHDSFADHLLQLRIIQALQKKGLDLAVAMEMFPTSSQQALDDYLLGRKKMDEATFLRTSHWFDVWRYDWRLFRPIFTFCRNHSIPVYGINIEREIVSAVFADGHTDNLSPEQIQSISPDRDLGVKGYVERLRLVHGYHADAPHGKGKGISGFIQSQAIWDESMAENIAEILQDNPDKTVVVIAGSQHTRKDSGIPPRLLRRMNVKQASVVNLYGKNATAAPQNQADYFFLSEPKFLEAQGKIGIMLGPEKDEEGKERLRITGLSHAGKAKKAGIVKDDIIISINGQAAKNMEDIGILMMDTRPGDLLNMVILRKGESNEFKEQTITIELSDLTKPANHP